ncbi:hypothetical protein [Xylanibacter muris]|uniref:Uncharacterized protein n=1 Tax=Xylanibacter muris TaxID=2736290 RepID=A0ABX2AMY0_9BACT|nr:hypothetical protein [Xylanibacter muris]NPD91540.1 hypothetical protein [Xylanibacter muris]
MDKLSRELNTFLVRMGMCPESIGQQTVHYMEHIFHLLDPVDEQAVARYYGLFGEVQLSLAEIARGRGMTEEDMMAVIDSCIHRLAVTPEWQMIKNTLKH